MSALFEAGGRLKYYQWLCGISVLLTVIATWNFWSADHTCPTAPVIGIYSFIQRSGGIAYKILLVLSALLFAMRVRHSAWLLILLLTAGFADDMNRVRPDFYQYFIIALFYGCSGLIDSAKLFNSFRIIHGGLYLWTGILKLNRSFLHRAPDFFLNAFHIPSVTGHARYFILIIPLVEIAIGLVFLFGRKFRFALIAALILHLCIIIQLAASGWNLNMIIYNVFLLSGNFILFNKNVHAPSLPGILAPGTMSLKIATLLFVCLPALNLVHAWPDYMSAGMYSYNRLEAAVYTSPAFKKALPEVAKKAVFDSRSGPYVSLNYWMEYETGCVPSPQVLVYNKMFRQLQARYAASDSIRLVLYR